MAVFGFLLLLVYIFACTFRDSGEFFNIDDSARKVERERVKHEENKKNHPFKTALMSLGMEFLIMALILLIISPIMIIMEAFGK